MPVDYGEPYFDDNIVDPSEAARSAAESSRNFAVGARVLAIVENNPGILDAINETQGETVQLDPATVRASSEYFKEIAEARASNAIAHRTLANSARIDI